MLNKKAIHHWCTLECDHLTISGISLSDHIAATPQSTAMVDCFLIQHSVSVSGSETSDRKSKVPLGLVHHARQVLPKCCVITL